MEQIAQDVGYGDRAAFAKLFKRITGNTRANTAAIKRARLPPETTGLNASSDIRSVPRQCGNGRPAADGLQKQYRRGLQASLRQ